MRLGELLVASGKVSRAEVDDALDEQRRHRGRRLGEILVARKIVTEDVLAETLAAEFRLEFVDLAAYAPDAQALALVPAPVILEHRVLPIALTDGTLVVAIGDPLALDAVDAVRMSSGHSVREVIAVQSQIDERISALLHPNAAVASSVGTIDEIVLELARTELSAPSETAGRSPAVTEQNAGVVRLVNRILVDAFGRRASDIHIEPNGAHDALVVRMRVDGECFVYHTLPAVLAAPVVARVKIMAELDIAEHRKPQDGKVRFQIGEAPLELRVATLPTVGGNEDVVLRLLPPSKPRPLTAMALSPRNLAELEKLLAKPYGLVLCVGPTGSGKTTTLHSALGTINTPDRKIWTAEDPVEITQRGLRQVQVNRKIGFDFASAMRSFLRADPDVIMVGEMRDRETATTAIEASLTGHLVLSTLHTNNAPETVVRLLDMGLEPFGFADSLLGVLAQRLVRCLCVACRVQCAPTSAETEAMTRALGPAAADVRAVWTGKGCDACDGSGYRGRMALHELLVADDAIRASIARRGSIDELRTLSERSGMTTLLEDGVTKAIAGDTDLRQVLAACSR